MSEASPFRFLLSPNSGAPLYRQLMDQLRVEIFSGRLAPGAMLPSVRQVAQDLEINPMTVSKAYSQLQEEGVLERVPGLGMRIPENRDDERRELVRRAVLPSLRRAVEEAARAGLSRSELLSVFEPLLEELDHE
jgi:GntR family transcriptional regulator